MSASPLHSIIALSSARGGVYLCWREGLVKRILPGEAEYWRGGERGEFKPVEVKSTSVTWSNSSSSPGLLAVMGADCVKFLICDQYII